MDHTALRLACQLNRAAREAVAGDHEPSAAALRRLELLAHRFARHVGADPVAVLCDAWLAAADAVDPLHRSTRHLTGMGCSTAG